MFLHIHHVGASLCLLMHITNHEIWKRHAWIFHLVSSPQAMVYSVMFHNILTEVKRFLSMKPGGIKNQSHDPCLRRKGIHIPIALDESTFQIASKEKDFLHTKPPFDICYLRNSRTQMEPWPCIPRTSQHECTLVTNYCLIPTPTILLLQPKNAYITISLLCVPPSKTYWRVRIVS